MKRVRNQCKALSSCAIRQLASCRLFLHFSRVELLIVKATEEHLQRLSLTFSFRLKGLTANQRRKHRLD